MGGALGELSELEIKDKTTRGEVLRPSLVDLKVDLGRSGRENNISYPRGKGKSVKKALFWTF